MEESFPGADQWNSLHERLVDAWKKQAALLPPGSPLYFANSEADELGEDLMTVAYLKETAEQAGLETEWISMEEIGWDRLSGRFVDSRLRFIRSIFKLYPWEWLTTDRFADHVLDTLDNGGGTGTTLWIEPAWKMLLSNKALLAILWELYPGHPNLLPAYLDGPRELADTTGYVAKPLLGREGAGVTIHRPGTEAPTPRTDLCCYQELAPLPDFDGNRVVLGAWVVENESAGLGIRESSGLVTDEYARFPAPRDPLRTVARMVDAGTRPSVPPGRLRVGRDWRALGWDRPSGERLEGRVPCAWADPNADRTVRRSPMPADLTPESTAYRAALDVIRAVEPRVADAIGQRSPTSARCSS